MAKSKRKVGNSKMSNTPRVSAAPRSTSALSAAMAAKARTEAASAPTFATLSQLCLMYVVFFVLHAVVLYLANMFFPAQVVLGTHLLTPLMAVLYSVAVFTLIGIAFTPVIQQGDYQLNLKLSPTQWMLSYFIVNAVALWGVARMAEMLGLGLASWVVAVILAAIVTPIQGVIAMKIMGN